MHTYPDIGALYRPYGLKGGGVVDVYVNLKCTVLQALRLCTDCTVYRCLEV